jgi:hypothetical protein
MRKWLQARPVVAAGIATLVVVGIAGVIFMQATRRHAAPTSGRAAAPPSAAPICNGNTSDISSAGQAMPFQVLLPDTALASNSNIDQVCVVEKGTAAAGGEEGIAVRFASGVIPQEDMPPDASPDPTTAWKNTLDAYPDAGYSIGSVAEQPALLIGPGGPFNAYGGAIWVDKGVEFEVKGDGKIPLVGLARDRRFPDASLAVSNSVCDRSSVGVPQTAVSPGSASVRPCPVHSGCPRKNPLLPLRGGRPDQRRWS